MVEVPRWGTVIVSALLMISPVSGTGARLTGRSVAGLGSWPPRPRPVKHPSRRIARPARRGPSWGPTRCFGRLCERRTAGRTLDSSVPEWSDGRRILRGGFDEHGRGHAAN